MTEISENHKIKSDSKGPDASAKANSLVLVKYILAGLFGILVIIGIVLFLKHRSNYAKVAIAPPVDINAIRRLFATPQDDNPQATSSPPGNIMPQVSAPVLPRGLGNSAASVNHNPLPSASAPAFVKPSAPQLYSNAALGFQMEISNLWQASQSGGTVVFTNAQGQTISVQAYNVFGEGIDTIQTQLQGSPNVSNLRSTNFLGQSALTFQNNSSGQQGLAVIYNNKVFYILAQNLSQPPVSTFAFLQ